MEGKRFTHSVRLQNFLSYGSEEEEIELQPLNVLIGPNASGKSNLIEACVIDYRSGGQPAIHFDKYLVEMAHQLNAEIDVDFYVLPEEVSAA